MEVVVDNLFGPFDILYYYEAFPSLRFLLNT